MSNIKTEQYNYGSGPKGITKQLRKCVLSKQLVAITYKLITINHDWGYN